MDSNQDTGNTLAHHRRNKKGPSDRPKGLAWFGLLEHYFFAGAAGTAGAVVVAVDVTVDVTADFVAGAGVCC